MKLNCEPLGKHVRLVDCRNFAVITTTVLGISIDKEFMPSVANVIGTDLSRYKLISKGLFACNPMHVGRDERLPSNPALFVSLSMPSHRLQIGGVERRLRELGKRLNLPRVHPHKFRRTLATAAIDKGMPIEQVQQLLGHQKIDTTMHYAMVKQQNVKLAHRKYIG